MDEAELAATDETLRQRLLRWLRTSERSFEDLRVGLELSARQLEEELRHVERSARQHGGRLVVTPPECRECGFDFPGRLRKHLHPPGRCPRCKSQRIESPRFRVAE